MFAYRPHCAECVRTMCKVDRACCSLRHRTAELSHQCWQPRFDYSCVYSYGPGYRIPVGGEIFLTCPDRLWGPPSLLYNAYRVFPGGRCGRGVTLTPHPLLNAEVTNRAMPLLSLRPFVAYERVKPTYSYGCFIVVRKWLYDDVCDDVKFLYNAPLCFSVRH